MNISYCKQLIYTMKLIDGKFVKCIFNHKISVNTVKYFIATYSSTNYISPVLSWVELQP